MNETDKKRCTYMRSLSSEEAASWLISEFPLDNENYGEAIKLIPHRSWKRTDQSRLANYYLSRIPFASSRAYESFFLCMSVRVIVEAIKNNMPTSKSDLDLMNYYLPMLFRKFTKRGADREMVDNLLKELEK